MATKIRPGGRRLQERMEPYYEKARQLRARDDPEWFFNVILGRPTYVPGSGKPGLYSKQIESAESVRDNRRTAEVGANGTGKDYTSGMLMLWWMYSWDDAMAIVYGPTTRQVNEIIWKEGRVAFKGANVRLPGRMYDGSSKYVISDFREASGFSSDSSATGAGIQGFHAGHMLVIVTEAHGVSQNEIDSLIRLNPDRMLLTGNPLSSGGEFYDAFHSKSDIYNTITISAFDTPNLQEGKTIIPGMATVEMVEERAREFGEESPMYRQSILGEFPKDDMASIIPLSKAYEAVDRDLDVCCPSWFMDVSDDLFTPNRMIHPDDCAVPECVNGYMNGADPGSAMLGVDIARYGEDTTVIAYRRGPVIRFLWKGKGKSLMETVTAIREILESRPEIDMCVIDDTGLGGGVTDRLRELEFEASIVAFTAGARAEEPDKFNNATMEAWWKMREAFVLDDNADIQRDELFIAQVSTRKYKTQSDKTIRLESKDEMKGRLRKSPDEADAVAMTYSPAVGPPRIRWFA